MNENNLSGQEELGDAPDVDQRMFELVERMLNTTITNTTVRASSLEYFTNPENYDAGMTWAWGIADILIAVFYPNHVYTADEDQLQIQITTWLIDQLTQS